MPGAGRPSSPAWSLGMLVRACCAEWPPCMCGWHVACGWAAGSGAPWGPGPGGVCACVGHESQSMRSHPWRWVFQRVVAGQVHEAHDVPPPSADLLLPSRALEPKEPRVPGEPLVGNAPRKVSGGSEGGVRITLTPVQPQRTPSPPRPGPGLSGNAGPNPGPRGGLSLPSRGPRGGGTVVLGGQCVPVQACAHVCALVRWPCPPVPTRVKILPSQGDVGAGL